MKWTRTGALARVFAAAAIAATMTPAEAQIPDLEVGFRPMVLASQGEPANDMLGGGIVATWNWRDDWFFGVALDGMNFDYERPQRALGIVQSPNTATIDGSGSFTRLSGWIERRYDRPGPWDWFWMAGIGFASPDANIVSGDTASGGTFNIVTQTSSEAHLLSGIGMRRELGEKWMFTGTFHLEHHLTDYKFQDTVSGLSGTIGSHTPVGLSALFSYRF